ncbi:helix-turn-helix transcriptional regulator [Hydrocarboniphaga effusa]|jgi:transcriptional regulator with XRE-family HTH domain|uniref:helix-turn-helix transcriptional regulator n=1 Tax=Hydrocarboniphaga effusa TaxID=243629 RepID=UPI00398C000F
MSNSQLSDALRLLRSYHDESQIQLASHLGISRSYLSEIESGRKQPSLDLLKSYSERFGLPLSAILLFSETVESGSLADKVRRSSVATALKLLNWADDRRSGKRGS